jgi:hypothetical protein
VYVSYYHAVYKGACEVGSHSLEINIEKTVAMKNGW